MAATSPRYCSDCRPCACLLTWASALITLYLTLSLLSSPCLGEWGRAGAFLESKACFTPPTGVAL